MEYNGDFYYNLASCFVGASLGAALGAYISGKLENYISPIIKKGVNDALSSNRNLKKSNLEEKSK